jgi:hypothetical protein
MHNGFIIRRRMGVALELTAFAGARGGERI